MRSHPMRGVIPRRCSSATRQLTVQLEADEARFAHRATVPSVRRGDPLRVERTRRGGARGGAGRSWQSNFRDPEGASYLTLLLPRLGQVDLAEMLLLARPSRGEASISRSAAAPHAVARTATRAAVVPGPGSPKAEERQRENAEAFIAEGGPQILGLRAGSTSSDPGWPSASKAPSGA